MFAGTLSVVQANLALFHIDIDIEPFIISKKVILYY